MVDGPPEIVEFAVYPDENFVEMPGPVRVVGVLEAASSDRLREEWTEPVPPESHCLMRDVDTALVEQIFYVPQLEWEADVHHHRQADDLGRSLEVPEWVTHQKTLRNQAHSLKRSFI